MGAPQKLFREGYKPSPKKKTIIFQRDKAQTFVILKRREKNPIWSATFATRPSPRASMIMWIDFMR